MCLHLMLFAQHTNNNLKETKVLPGQYPSAILSSSLHGDTSPKVVGGSAVLSPAKIWHHLSYSWNLIAVKTSMVQGSRDHPPSVFLLL